MYSKIRQAILKNYLYSVFSVFVFFAIVIGFIAVQKQPAVALTTPPAIITYQGKLLESGTAVTSSREFVFQLFTTSSGGTAFYSVTSTITPSSGIFAIDLGDTSQGYPAIDTSYFSSTSSVYLQVTVSSTAMTPRKRLTSAAFALNSQYLMGVSAATSTTSTYIPVSDASGDFTFNKIDIQGKSKNPTLLSSVTTTDDIDDIIVDGNYAYVSDNNSSIYVIDISDINNVSTTASTTLITNNITSFAHQGDYLYAMGSAGNLYIYSTAIPTSLTLLKTLSVSTSSLNSGFVSGKYLYIACQSEGVRVVDISNPTNARLVGSLYSSATAMNDIYVKGNYAYVADGTNGLKILDVSNPLAITVAGFSYNTPGNAYKVTVNNNYAYVSDYDYGLQIIDIRNITRPVLAGSYNTDGYTYDAFVSGNYAYLADNSGGLVILDVSNPASIVLKGSYTQNAGYVEIFGQGNKMYVAHSNTMKIFDVTGAVISNTEIGSANITNLSISGDADFDQNLNVRGNINVGANGGVLVNGKFVAGGQSYFTDMLNIDGRVLKSSIAGTYDPGVQFKGVKVKGNYLYTVSDSGLVQSFNISNPTNPALMEDVTLDYGAQSNMFVSGNKLYTVHTSYGLGINDISKPGSTLHLKYFSTSNALDVDISGKYAYIADGNDGLKIVDISSAANPALVGSIDTGIASRVKVRGNYAYVNNDNTTGTIKVVDISNPRNPIEVNSSINYTASEIYLSGNYLYLGSTEFAIYNISNPVSPAFQSSSTLTINALFVSGNYAYIGSGTSLKIYDVSSSTSPLLVNTLTLNAAINKIDGDGNYLYVGTDTDLEVIDVSGAIISNTKIGTAKISNLSILGYANFEQGVDIKGGATIDSSGLLLFGDLAMNSATSSITATNTINFSHTALFKSSASSSQASIFEFDTINTVTSTSKLLTIRNNGTAKLVLDASGNLGINSSTPSSLLTVGGTASITGTTTIANNTLYVSASNNRVGINTSTPGYDFVVNGQSYFVGTSTFTGPLNMKGRKSNPITVSNYGSDSVKVKVAGNYAYTVDSMGAFKVLDISNPASVSLLTSFNSEYGGSIENIFVAGNYAYLAQSISGMSVMDISRPASSSVISNIDTTDARDIFVKGKNAFVADYSDGLKIIDVSDPVKPILKGTLDTDSATKIVVNGNYAYIGDSSSGVRIIDISDITNPILVKTISTTTLNGDVYDLDVSGNYLYVVTQSLSVFNISIPSAPVLQPVPLNVLGASYVDVSGNYAYISNSSDVYIVDVTVGQRPSLITTYPVGATANEISVNGNYLYVAASGQGLVVVDISGATISNTEIGTAKISNMSVLGMADFDQSLNVRGGLMVGNSGFLLSGDFGMSSPTTSLVATNTLNFSHTALFKTSVTSSAVNAFVFDTVNTITSSTASNFLLSVRNNGSSKFSVSTNGDVRAAGTLFAVSATVSTPGDPGDLAERVDVAADDTVEPGDVMMVDTNTYDTYRRTNKAYEQGVAGVISTNPTIVVGDGRTDYKAVMAMVGRVPIKVTAENGPIVKGDLLVSASTTGYAMKYDNTKDDGLNVVGVIGIALENLDSGSGKIMGLVRTGWVNNRHQTINSLQEELVKVAQVSGDNIQNNEQSLNVLQNSSGKLAFVADQDLNMNGFLIVNVASVASSNDKWVIDEKGRFTTNIQTNKGTKSFYAMQSETTELVLSGSDALMNGEKQIQFEEVMQEIIDPDKPIKVSITLTSEGKGVFVKEKNNQGFTVKEIEGGLSNASFDWVVIASRKNIDQIVNNGTEIQGGNNQVSGEDQNVGNTDTAGLNDQITTSTPDTPSSTPANNEDISSQTQSEPVVQPEPLTEPVSTEPVSNPDTPQNSSEQSVNNEPQNPEPTSVPEPVQTPPEAVENPPSVE